MPKVNITKNEIQALDMLMKDAKMPMEMGYTLVEFKKKIIEAFNKEMEQQQKEAAKAVIKQSPKLLAQVAKEIDDDELDE